MKLISKQPQKEFDFTLYRNYKIRSLNSNDLKSYAQNGDFIHIEFNKPIKNTNIEIKYSGYHPNLYSNNQAVVLPGYFAWYPMAGEKQLYCMFENQAIQDMDIIHISEIESVCITYQLKVITLYYAI